jgi:hypothetical protein
MPMVMTASSLCRYPGQSFFPLSGRRPWRDFVGLCCRRAASSAVGGDEMALADIGMYVYAPIQMSKLRLGRT